MCSHGGGWSEVGSPGEVQCRCCGVRRFRHYGAVRPGGLPHALVPSVPERRAADLAAARQVAFAVGVARWSSPRAHRPR
ncbi:DUF6255 family natural product biosynthesis protein [Streptomyces sp. NPDC053079]|uniref:DUF6255 family natural product biosynthesis protein n=1 Tax=Streptomyces sp. NPDC053079 TaxID=3365697 RepID=UPI0037D4439C